MTVTRRPFLLQMAGWMGSGKSTIARALATQIGAVVLDHDTTKSSVMAVGVDDVVAGKASYELLFALAADALGDGHAVIIDSPSAYDAIPARGLALAQRARVGYYFVECECPEDICDVRITARTPRPSQVANVDAARGVRRSTTRSPHRPATGVLTLDTTRPFDSCVAEVLAYLDTEGASGPVVGAAD